LSKTVFWPVSISAFMFLVALTLAGPLRKMLSLEWGIVSHTEDPYYFHRH
jgi:hypothetical protein